MRLIAATVTTAAFTRIRIHQHGGSALALLRENSCRRYRPLWTSTPSHYRHHHPRPSFDHPTRRDKTTLRQAESDEEEDVEGTRMDELALPSDEEIEKKTTDWVRKVVVGLNLCPFADRPMREGKLKVVVLRSGEDMAVASCLLREMNRLKSESGTSLIVTPEFYPHNFNDFLDIVDWANDHLLSIDDLDEHVQIAPFHPHFQFEGSGEDGVDNFTNRSPFPMFHILREEEVSHAVDLLGGDAGKVWRRNINMLSKFEEKFGMEGVKKIMAGEKIDGMEDVIRASLIMDDGEMVDEGK